MSIELFSKVIKITRPFIPKNCKDCSTPYTSLIKLSDKIFIPLFMYQLKGDLVRCNCGFKEPYEVTTCCKSYKNHNANTIYYIWQVYIGDKLVSTFIDLVLALEYIRQEIGVKVIIPNFYINKDKLCAEFDFGDYLLYPNEVNYLSYRSKYTCFSNLY